MAPLFPNEDAYDDVIRPVARQYGPPAALVKAVIAHESHFVPDAIRREPTAAAGGDASRGLMQVLFKTARDELGFNGSPDALFNPGVNIPLGVRFLAKQFHRVGGEWPAALSAYNGGYRPALAFGRRATAPLVICLAHDPLTGRCVKERKVPIGEFANQPYVDSVLAYWEHYKATELASAPPPPATGCLGALVLWFLGSSFGLMTTMGRIG